MDDVVKKNKHKINALCKKHNVESFFLFGSAARNEMNTTSDFDFLVRFSDRVELLEYADNYFSLLENLKKLLGRDIDLVSETALKNPVLIDEINKTKVPLYEF